MPIADVRTFDGRWSCSTSGGRRMAARSRRGAQHIPMGEYLPASRDRSRRDAVVVCHAAAVAAGRAVPGATATRRSTSRRHAGLGRAGGRRHRRRRCRHRQPSLGWSDDPGVFPVRDAVERAGPAACLVPAVQRHPAGAVGHATAFGVERATHRAAGEPKRSERPKRPASAATGIPLDRGSARCRTAGPPAQAQPGPDSAVRGDSALGSG